MDELYWSLGVYGATLLVIVAGAIEYVYFRFGIDEMRKDLRGIREAEWWRINRDVRQAQQSRIVKAG